MVESSSGSDEFSDTSNEQLITNNNERTEEEIETVSEVESDTQQEKRKGKIRKDKFGRYHIRFKDRRAKRVYHIEAPNNVFFNDELQISRK